jgi:hypothetical protein
VEDRQRPFIVSDFYEEQQFFQNTVEYGHLCKTVPVHAVEAFAGSGGVAALNLNVGILSNLHSAAALPPGKNLGTH